jgi:hypothetical protein
VGEGLRSVEVTSSPNQERVLYPARRSPFIGLGLYGAPAFIMPLAALFWIPLLWRGRSPCTLEALRGTSGGATMVIPGGAGTALTESTVTFSHVLGAPASLIGSEFPATWLRPFALPRSYAARLARAELCR